MHQDSVGGRLGDALSVCKVLWTLSLAAAYRKYEDRSVSSLSLWPMVCVSFGPSCFGSFSSTIRTDGCVYGGREGWFYPILCQLSCVVP